MSIRAAAILLVLSMPVAAIAAEPPADQPSPRHLVAVQRGLEHLSSRQQADGAFGPSGGHAGITALAALAFMSEGSLPGRGRYGSNVRRCIQFLLRNADESGLIGVDGTHGPMYGHCLATLCLAEVYGMSPDAAIRPRLLRAVRLLQQTQSRDGGWRYQPVPFDADISVTICAVMALRSARDAGIKVPRDVIDNAVDYIQRCQNRDGGFAYMPGGTESAFARSAAGVATLYYAGEFESEALQRGLKYLRRASSTALSADVPHFFYGHYYASQAMLLAGGKYWDDYFPAVREELLRRQDSRSGAWDSEAGTDYATAMAVIVLQMPNRRLPIMHGKGPGN